MEIPDEVVKRFDNWLKPREDGMYLFHGYLLKPKNENEFVLVDDDDKPVIPRIALLQLYYIKEVIADSYAHGDMLFDKMEKAAFDHFKT